MHSHPYCESEEETERRDKLWPTSPTTTQYYRAGQESQGHDTFTTGDELLDQVRVVHPQEDQIDKVKARRPVGGGTTIRGGRLSDEEESLPEGHDGDSTTMAQEGTELLEGPVHIAPLCILPPTLLEEEMVVGRPMTLVSVGSVEDKNNEDCEKRDLGR